MSISIRHKNCTPKHTTETFIDFEPFLGPGTSPHWIGFEIHALLGYSCVRSSDVVFYGHQIHLGRFFGQPSGDNIFSESASKIGPKYLI